MDKRQKIELKPGVKYKGYGFLNPYGEFEFTPEQTGSRQGKRRLIKEGDGFTLSETNQVLIVHLTLAKEFKGLLLIKKFLSITNQIITFLRDYEI